MTCKEAEQIIDEALALGFTYEKLRNSHVRLRHPDAPREAVVLSLTSRSSRAQNNTRADIRRIMRKIMDDKVKKGCLSSAS